MLNLLFLDIETFAAQPWHHLTTWKQEAFKRHYYDENEDGSVEEAFARKSGLLAEFGKIICCSVGYEDASGVFRCMAIAGNDEKQILVDLAKLVTPFYNKGFGIAGWNTNAFDIPFIAKRYIINEMFVPFIFNSYGVKPWERRDIDVMNAYKMGGYASTSLEVACAAFDIPVKFTEHTGKNIWEQKEEDIDFNELKTYCNNDVYSTYHIFKRLQLGGYFSK